MPQGSGSEKGAEVSYSMQALKSLVFVGFLLVIICSIIEPYQRHPAVNVATMSTHARTPGWGSPRCIVGGVDESAIWSDRGLAIAPQVSLLLASLNSRNSGGYGTLHTENVSLQFIDSAHHVHLAWPQ
jgi:hypothetical protein